MRALSKQGLLAIASVVLVGCAGSAESEVAKPAAPGAPHTASPAAQASGATDNAQQQMLYYVCGEAGVEKHASAPDPAHPFNMGVSFVSASNGAPLTDVSVKVRRHGRVLMDFIAAGPRCVFSLPEADYRIEGTYRGEMKFDVFQTGNMNAQMKW